MTTTASDFTQIAVGPQPVQVCPPLGPGVNVTVYNADINNVVTISRNNSVALNASNGAPIQPLTSAVLDASHALYAVAPSGTAALVILPLGGTLSPSPSQIAAQIDAIGLAKDTSVNNPAFGPATQSAQVNQETAIPANIQVYGTPPFIPGVMSFSGTRLSAAGSPYTLNTFTQDSRVWYAMLSLSIATDSTYAGGLQGVFATLATGSGTVILACEGAIGGPNQNSDANQNVSVGGVEVSAGDTLVVNVNNGTSITDAFIRVSVVVWTSEGTGSPVSPISTGELVFINPSGDHTGVIDAQAVMTAWGAGQTPWLTPGDFYFIANTVVSNTPNQWLYTFESTTIHAVGTGDTIRMFSTNTPNSLQGGGILGNPTIDGSSSGAGSNGIHAGDFLRMRFECTVQFYNKAGSKNVWFDNKYTFAEQITGTLFVEGGTQNVVFDNNDVSGFSTGSFDRACLDIFVVNAASGDGVVFNNGAFIRDGELGIRGNFSCPAPAVYAVVRVLGQNSQNFSQITDTVLKWGVELRGTTGNVPTTIVFGTVGENIIRRCTGIIDFGGNNTFTPAPNPFFGVSGFGSFQFDGPITGDVNLMRSQGTGQESFPDTTLVNGSQIPAQYTSLCRVATQSGGNITSVTLQGIRADTHGGIVTVLNIGTGNITFDIPANSNVADGTADVILPNTAATFYWNAVNALWYRVY